MTHFAWDYTGEYDYFRLSWYLGSVEIGNITTLATDAEVNIIDPHALRFEVVAYVNGVPSGPSLPLWIGVQVSIHPTPQGIRVYVSTEVGKRYSFERNPNLLDAYGWQEFAEIEGTGAVEGVGGGSEDIMFFRCWVLDVVTAA